MANVLAFKGASSHYNDMVSDGWVMSFESVLSPHLGVRLRSTIKTFNDMYACSWQRQAVFGRMDTIQSFENVTRTINFSWQMAAASIEEAKENLQKLSILIQMLYPSYDKYKAARFISGAPLIKLQFANWIVDAVTGGPLVGSVSGFTHRPMVQAGFFTDDKSSSSPGSLYPKIIDLSCTFYPLHSHNLGNLGWKQAPNFPYNDKGPSPSAAVPASVPIPAAASPSPAPAPNDPSSTTAQVGQAVEKSATASTATAPPVSPSAT